MLLIEGLSINKKEITKEMLFTGLNEE